MKKNLFVAAAMMVAMTACVKEADVNVNVEENVPQTEEKVWVEFTAGVETKAVLDGTVVTWEEDDLISINGVEFAIPEEEGAISEDKKTAKFKAAVDSDFLEADSFTAVYPATAVEDANAGNVVVPAEQDGKANVVAVATVSDLGETLQFRHLASFFKFQVPVAATEVTISADETLVGTVNNVVYDETISYSVVSGDNTITLTGSFETGKTYYAAVLPGEKNNLTVRFDGYLSKAWPNAVTIEYGMIAYMKNLPAPVKSSWAIVGSKADFGAWNHNASKYFFFNEEGDRLAAKNVPFSSSDEFKVVDGNNNWYALSSVAYNSWKQVTTSGSNMKLSENTYDLYLNTGTKYLYITNAGSTAPKVVPVEENHIYLSPSANWLQDNAHFMAWVWKDNGQGKVYNFKEVQNATGLYEITVPAGSNRMILFRVDPAKKFTDGSTSWPGNEHWHKTDNLTINGNLYTVVNWHEEGTGFSTVTSLL